ncbi:uncharacterized protein LOC124645232 [Helicoverpa zea]|uniref:uncharacterized protein LOC124645232 n=1 Tax=Helicoverpa zea TaxID=7113 RepID=UPI001F56D601|nr:uncharacterized protein LOC124645232 [Helicoverpa zea]
MAYNLAPRFSQPQKYFTLLDPGAYQNEKVGLKQNVAPFLSRTPRNTHTGSKLWTQADYDQTLPRNIPNCSAMLSKQPRFPYEAFSAEDLAEILCKCGILSPCECPTGQGQEKQEEIICQGKVKRRLFKGPTPRSVLGDEGLSTPSRRDHGFKITSEGNQFRLRDEYGDESPPFYDARVKESTAYYQGCKWSKRTSKRCQKSLEVRPGPADYSFERKPTADEICAEKIRAFKRKTTAQLRFMDLIEKKNLLDNPPGPTTYDPKLPKGTELQNTLSKDERFPKPKTEVSPGPADHKLRRDFDPIKHDALCHATLPEPPCFGSKTNRFKIQREEGPSPASYDVRYSVCNYLHCRTAPFGSSAKRFIDNIVEESEESDSLDLADEEIDEQAAKPCIKPTWEFKSKTIRMKPLVKKHDEPGPADLPQIKRHVVRSRETQYIAPFFSSEGRFQPWHNWIPVHGALVVPGPGYYCLDKPRCNNAVNRGSLSRAQRFPTSSYKTPAPNKYKRKDGIETVLNTHNKRLKNNLKNQYKHQWEPPKPKKVLSLEEREQTLLQKSITLLESKTELVKKTIELPKEEETKPKTKQKMLRSFLYAYPLPKYL